MDRTRLMVADTTSDGLGPDELMRLSKIYVFTPRMSTG